MTILNYQTSNAYLKLVVIMKVLSFLNQINTSLLKHLGTYPKIVYFSGELKRKKNRIMNANYETRSISLKRITSL